MFSHINYVSIPIIVTDESNRVVFKNISAGKAFSGIRQGSYMNKRFMYESDADILETFCQEYIPIVLTINLVGYTLCCLVTQKELNESKYRFYTVAPLMFELFEMRSNDPEIKEFIKDFEEYILAYVRYMNQRLDGNEEKIPARIKGRIRANAGRILYYGDKLRKLLGVPGESISDDKMYTRKMDVGESVETLINVFNHINKSENKFELKLARKAQRVKCNVKSVAFGRLFVYTAFLCLKYCFKSPEILVSQNENSVRINFTIGTTAQKDTELFNLDFGYIKAYAARNGMCLGICDDISRSTVIYIEIDGVEMYPMHGLIEPTPPREDYIKEILKYYTEISEFVSFDCESLKD